MQITVYGASGTIGQRLVAALLTDGHTVVATVNRHNPFNGQPGLRVVRVDVHDQAAVAEALAGSQAVMSALGSWGTPTKDIVSTATRNIVAALAADSPVRVITLTGAEAWMPDQRPSLLQKATHRMMSLVAPRIMQDAEAHLQTLSDSGLHWTCVRSPIMRSFGSTSGRLQSRPVHAWTSVHRKAVVTHMVVQLESDQWLKQAPFLNS